MTTGKRQIPINGHNPRAGTTPGAPSGAGTGAPGAAQGTAGPEPVDKLETLSAERDALVAERDALADSLLRLRAEFDNYRKRASRDSIEARTRAQGELLGDFLPVLDNLERALDAAEHHEEGKALDGVRLTRNLFLDLLTRAGVEEIEGVGSPFDPEVHEAMLVRPSEQDEGSVATVFERGYRQGERVLRPARVVVSAGRLATGGSDSTSGAQALSGPAGPKPDGQTLG